MYTNNENPVARHHLEQSYHCRATRSGTKIAVRVNRPFGYIFGRHCHKLIWSLWPRPSVFALASSFWREKFVWPSIFFESKKIVRKVCLTVDFFRKWKNYSKSLFGRRFFSKVKHYSRTLFDRRFFSKVKKLFENYSSIFFESETLFEKPKTENKFLTNNTQDSKLVPRFHVESQISELKIFDSFNF
jgi:hypothetical protein